MEHHDHKNDPPLAPQRYTSVEALMKGEGFDQEVQEIHKKLKDETRVAHKLAMLRTAAGVTQAEMAKHLGCTQGAISKLESGKDEDLTLRHITAYSKALNQSVEEIVGLLDQAEKVK